MDLHIFSHGTLVPEGFAVCFIQQGFKFTDVWHLMWFFASSLI